MLYSRLLSKTWHENTALIGCFNLESHASFTLTTENHMSIFRDANINFLSMMHALIKTKFEAIIDYGTNIF